MADFSVFSPDGGITSLNVKDAPARNMVTDAFSASTAYAVGDYCIYDGVLYICTTAHEGAWISGDFAATTIANELKNAGGDLSSYQTKNLVTPLIINGSSRTTVESALGALNTVDGTKQSKTLATALNINGSTITTVEGALSALGKVGAMNLTFTHSSGSTWYTAMPRTWFKIPGRVSGYLVGKVSPGGVDKIVASALSFYVMPNNTSPSITGIVYENLTTQSLIKNCSLSSDSIYIYNESGVSDGQYPDIAFIYFN